MFCSIVVVAGVYWRRCRNRRRLSESFHPSVNLNSRLIAVSSDCKCLYVGGQLDNSIKMYTLPKFRLLSSSTVQHIDIVTCLALDDSGSQLISGSRDTTCIVWDVSSALSGPCLKSVQVCTENKNTFHGLLVFFSPSLFPC